jgi:uncharacterized protein (TIGR02172 family)
MMKELALDKPLARGRTADVYPWGDESVLKLFYDWFALEDIEYELKIARAVHASGVRTPAVRGLVQVAGRNGLVYERVRGRNMFEVLQKRPWLLYRLARRLAKLHAEMHDTVFNADAPAGRAKLHWKVERAEALTDSRRRSLLSEVERLSEGDRVCHGDFHPGNVIMSDKGGFIIDWIDASRGNPLADTARTSILLLGVAEVQVRDPLPRFVVRLLHRVYLRHYFELRPGGVEEYRRWLPIAAGARLSEGIPELEAWLVERAGL